jgi:hypothetical protein
MYFIKYYIYMNIILFAPLWVITSLYVGKTTILLIKYLNSIIFNNTKWRYF